MCEELNPISKTITEHTVVNKLLVKYEIWLACEDFGMFKQPCPLIYNISHHPNRVHSSQQHANEKKPCSNIYEVAS